MTKQQQQIINNYNKSTNHSLKSAYTSYSTEKARAEKNILSDMTRENGWGFKILGANTFSFSCAYLRQNVEHGQVEIVYHTAQNKKVFDYIY